MTLLFDQNISFKLLSLLGENYSGSKHVRDVGMERSDDQEIWEYSRDNGFAIVSKDEDFRQLSFLYGSPPKVVWLKLGNCTTQYTEHVLSEDFSKIAEFLEEEQGSFLILESSTA